MRIFLKIIFAGLLLVLMVALGTKVAALHHGLLRPPISTTAPVVVRKAIDADAAMPHRIVRPLAGHASVPPHLQQRAATCRRSPR